MAANKAKKVTKMATKACPECDQQIPVACKSCPCGFIFISRRLLNAKQSEKSPPPNLDNKSAAKRRRTERARREKANSALTKDLENRKRSRSDSQSEQIRRRRGRPKTTPSKKHDDEKGPMMTLQPLTFLLYLCGETLGPCLVKFTDPLCGKSQKDKKKKVMYMPVFQMKGPLYFQWHWLK
ncbi:UPF0547 protein C16orf87 homolog isoform X2 [Carcharodon carcharias]|uniref:UPF0547 protein C16orf87 homolog isoform X2 n=1 Tax=Carcharodon carcharias TaxID=13397 RepID=UPI001B7F65D0|nr:UPF0547 protein C16orf87 homolog isoform X2 [Carcharodon carcharias]